MLVSGVVIIVANHSPTPFSDYHISLTIYRSATAHRDPALGQARASFS